MLQAQMSTTKAKIEDVNADIKKELRGVTASVKMELTQLRKTVMKAVGSRRV